MDWAETKSLTFFTFSTQILLFTNPQISLFNNFFIKNESYDTVHIFKNYFVTVFFSFQFQFSIFSCIQTDPKSILSMFPVKKENILKKKKKEKKEKKKEKESQLTFLEKKKKSALGARC